MTLSFIAFHMRDYQRDTQQLSLEGHGAYFLLLQHCWTHGRVPPDDASRAAICKVTVQRWRKLAPLVAGYFDANGENKRATVEIAKAEKLRTRKAMAGHNGGVETKRRRAAIAAATATATEQLQPQLQSSGSAAIKDYKITSTFSGTAREGAVRQNAAAEPAALPAGFAEKARQAVQQNAGTSYLVEALTKRGRKDG
jgi:uncharacterized protein YdaU (DUF1376 family)